MKKMKDWMIRAIKTFVQAFFGVFIPLGVTYLEGGFPQNWSEVWLYLSPAISAALAAGISAAWNIINEHMEDEE